jgi:peptide deformylase
VAIKPIRLFGDPVLHAPAEPVRDFDEDLRALVKDLADTMLDAPGAVGLAAPQIGVGLRVFTYYVEGRIGHLVNPALEPSEEQETGVEGCLSLPGLTFPARRAAGVVVKGVNLYGEPVTLTGGHLLARCVQHETDHLDGVLFVDRLDPERRGAAATAIREAEWSGEPAPREGTARGAAARTLAGGEAR